MLQHRSQELHCNNDNEEFQSGDMSRSRTDKMQEGKREALTEAGRAASNHTSIRGETQIIEEPLCGLDNRDTVYSTTTDPDAFLR